MKVKMLRTMKLLGTYPVWTFHKGRIYNAEPATNQPNWKNLGLYFVSKKNGQYILARTQSEIELVK